MSLLKQSLVYKPFNYPDFVEITKTHEEIHWVADEADLSEDITDWKNKLTKQEKEFVKKILQLFTQSDVVVGANYHDYLIPKIKNNEARNMLSSFANRESEHQRAYALLNDTLGFDDEIYSEFLEYKEMADKVDHMYENSNNSHHDLAVTMAKSVFNEGVSLFASFVMLLNLQRYGKLKGMNTIVEWSIRDETMHVDGISKMFRIFCEEHPRIVNDELKKSIYDIARQTVKLEDKFIHLAFKNNDIQGIEEQEVKDYIRYIADRRLIQLGLKPNWKQKENPLPWLEYILNGASHDNFFEKRVTEYSLSGMTGDWGWGDTEDDLTELAGAA